ncbi:MAG TPA: hypothetical protein VNS19_00800 [Acidimicrobiales bacterium]|nr:hypothetical protein [Acidimicrobiales bacterium]
MTAHGERALPARRAYVVDTDQLAGVVVEIDATEDLQALAVLQAGLHEPPEGSRLIHGYDVATAGLGAWVGDRRVRVSIWPAFIDAAGDIDAADPDDPEADVLVIDLDPLEHGTELEELVRLGRLIVAGPESGPVPLVVDVDRDLVREVLTAATTD